MKIEKGININDFGPHGYRWQFIHDMQVTDSVLVTDEIAKQAHESWDASRYRIELIRAFKRNGMKGKSRIMRDGSYRVWRVK